MTEDEMVGWHHRLNGHEFEQTPGDSKGQVSLACCSPWGHKELDMTREWVTTTKEKNVKSLQLLFIGHFPCTQHQTSAEDWRCRKHDFFFFFPLTKAWKVRASLVAQTVMNLPAMQGPEFDPRAREISWRREWLSTPVFLPGEFHGQIWLSN